MIDKLYERVPLVLSAEDKLSLYLKQFIAKQSDIKGQRGFLERVKKADDKWGVDSKGLDPSVLSRIINQRIRASDNVYEAIARIVLNRPDATAEQLWAVVNAYEFPADQPESLLSLVSGYTAWAGLLIGALGVADENGQLDPPSGIRFAFTGNSTSDAQGNVVRQQLDWIDNLQNITAHPADPTIFNTAYTARDLENLMLDPAKLVDGCFMLRETYAKTVFASRPNAPDSPVEICRIAVGYGTHMYVIGRDDALPDAPDVLPAVPPDAYGIVAQLDRLSGLFKQNFVDIYQLNNPTISQHVVKFLGYTTIRHSFKQGRNVWPLNLSEEGIGEQVKAIRDRLYDPDKANNLIVLVGFEPVLNRIYHRLLAVLPERHTVRYEYYNLARLIDMVSTYCLYCRPEVLRDKYKLVKMNQFLALINDRYAYDPVQSSSLANYLFPDHSLQHDSPNHDRLERVFSELHIRNNSLNMIRIFSQMLIEK